MKPEKSAQLTGLGVAATFITGLIFTLLTPSFNENWSFATSKDQEHFHLPYTDQQLHGRKIYQREGCVYCHSQQIRPLVGEMQRYSVGTSLAIPSDGREYVYDRPHFLGTRRIGPDLSRVGGKYTDDWQYSHLYYPQQMVPESIMPSFTWLFTKDADGNPVPTQECVDLVAYIQTLGSQRQVWDETLNNGQGGWRSWLKDSDRMQSQQKAEAAVNRAQTPVHGQ
jgi:cbb3-type cytochrome c oxidase subunit II